MASGDQSLNLGLLFAVEEDLIGKVASFCDGTSLANLARTCKTCNARCQNELEMRKQMMQNQYFQPREEGTCEVYWEDRNYAHDERPEWLGEPHEPGKWVEVKTVETFLGKKLEDLHACDLVQLDDYRGIGAYCAAVREGRLVLIKTGSEYGYTLPPDAYAAGEKFGYLEYYEAVVGYGGFIFYAAIPDGSSIFQKHVAGRPSEEHHLFANLLSGEEPGTYSGDVSADCDEPLYWARNCDELVNW